MVVRVTRRESHLWTVPGGVRKCTLYCWLVINGTRELASRPPVLVVWKSKAEFIYPAGS